MATTDETIPLIYAELRRHWRDPWEPYPYLDPLDYDLGLAPTLATARLMYDHGLIDDGLGANTVYLPTAGMLNGFFVRLMRPAVLPEESPSPVWHGVITEELAQAGGSDVVDADALAVQTGGTVLIARGLEYLLARAAVTGSWVKTTADDPVLVDELLPFNTLTIKGLAAIGNRSAAKYAGPGGTEAYVFSDTDEGVWTAEQIVEYLLAHFAPPALAVTLTGATANLAGWTEAMPPARTVLEGLNRIVRRDRGHAWRCIVTPAAAAGADAVAVKIFSDYPEDVTAGGLAIAKATERYTLAANADAVADVQIRRSTECVFDKVTARGGPIILMGTFTFANARLAVGWGDASATAYKASSDVGRAADKFRPVYTTFVATPANIPGGPGCNSEGWPDLTADAPLWRAGRSFLRQLPILASDDDSGAPAEFRPPLVACQISVGGELVYAPVDRLSECIEHAPNWPVHVLDGVMGLRVGARPNLYLAKDHFSGAAASVYSPVVDYESIVATLAWPSTSWLHVTRDIEIPLDVGRPRTLYIDLPEAECWYRLAGTVTDVVDGALVTQAEAMTLRTDRDKLATVCALAAAWHQRPRRAVQITYATLVHDMVPGGMLNRLTSPAGNTDVYAIVSRVRWDCRAGTTILETDFAELDYRAAAGLGRGGAKLNAPRLGGVDQRDAAANLPARDAAAVGMGSRPFLVTVEQDGYDTHASPLTAGRGGYDEDEETYENCTWTYTATDYLTGGALTMADGTAADELTPARPRMPGFAYFYAGEGGRPTEALACRDSTGELVLLYCIGEITDYEEC